MVAPGCDSWPSIAGVGCGLTCVGAGEEWARKVYALRGLRGVERQVSLTGGTRWPAGSSAGRMVVRKARRSRGQEPVQGSVSRPEFAQNQHQRLGGRRQDPGAPRSFDAGGHVAGSQACVGRTRSAATVWPCDKEECYMTYLPLRGCITT
jgi:hypothetical protein